MADSKKPLCVQHRDGWCAVDGELDNDDPLTVLTVCDMTILLPLGIEDREPDCVECLGVLAGKDDDG